MRFCWSRRACLLMSAYLPASLCSVERVRDREKLKEEGSWMSTSVGVISKWASIL